MKTPVDYSRITPEYLSQYVNFFYKEENWQYQPTSEHPSMQNVQAEGATAIWNRLLDDHIVLLADEVGMGKTIQALAVMATLWRQNPHARVLVYAPRESVAINWINEYNSFIYNHYRVHDDLVKMAMGEFPARKPFYCHNHGQLLNTFYYHNPQFSVGKTSSLSNLRNIENQIDPELLNQGFPERNWHDSKGEVNKFSQIGADSRNFLKNYFGTGNQPPIDLLIIDESHYYRNLNGGSQKVQAAQGFFGTGGSPKLADKVLLMTATPNHSGKHNVKNLFSYFQDTDKQSANNLLENHCIRRLRRLSAKGHTKYNYRKENPKPSQFQDLKESLFFRALS
jgi:SNF2 family DNA or RNA helicase